MRTYQPGLLKESQIKLALSDFLEYPVPISLSNPPGILTTTLVESGTNFLSIINFPKKRTSDITTAFTSLDLYSLVLALIFFVVLVLQFSFLIGQLRVVESATFIFRILVKEHHQASTSRMKYRFILTFTLVYHFLLTILIETTIGTNLVVLEQPKLIDSIDDMYRSNRVPIFIEVRCLLFGSFAFAKLFLSSRTTMLLIFLSIIETTRN